MGLGFPIIDIHSHVLPGLDDGAATVSHALRMCEIYVQQGVEVVVATPHMNDPRYYIPPQVVHQKVIELSDACQKRGIQLEILPGGAIRVSPRLLKAYDAGEVLTLCDSGKFLLLELPRDECPDIEEIISCFTSRGIRLILAHPERNRELASNPDLLAHLVERGCVTQVTAGALLGYFGTNAQIAGLVFLKLGLIHVVASDAHSTRGHRLILNFVAKMLGDSIGYENARMLFYENPAFIINRKCSVSSAGQGSTPRSSIVPPVG